MATHVPSSKWFKHRTAADQVKTLARCLTTKKTGPLDIEPTLEYIKTAFSDVDSTSCDTTDKRMFIPSRYSLVVIPKRRTLIVRMFYNTLSRRLTRVALKRWGRVPNSLKDTCRCLRNASELLRTSMKTSKVDIWNYLILGHHASTYAVHEKQLYKMMMFDNITEAALNEMENRQPGDFIVFPFRIPDKPLIVSPGNVRKELLANEFPMPAYALMYAILAQINEVDLDKEGPFDARENDLSICCTGDHYSLLRRDGKTDCVPVFSWDAYTLRIELRPVDDVGLLRPAIGFVPEK